MSTNRSKDRSSLYSFTFADGRHQPVSSRARRILAGEGPAFRRRSGGLQTGQRDGRERPVSSLLQRDALFAVVVQTLRQRHQAHLPPEQDHIYALSK
jgi:hypothetical protein